MYFVQAAQAPIYVTLPDGRVIAVPKLTLRQMGQWASEISDQRYVLETGDMTEPQKREHARFYPKTPPTTGELRALLRTVAGIERIIRLTFQTAGINAAEISGMLDNNGIGAFESLAMELADMDDTSKRKPPALMRTEDKQEETDPTK